MSDTTPAGSGCLASIGAMIRLAIGLVFALAGLLSIALPDPPCSWCGGDGRTECLDCVDGRKDCHGCDRGPRGMEWHVTARATDFLGRCVVCRGEGSLADPCESCAGARSRTCGLCGGAPARR